MALLDQYGRPIDMTVLKLDLAGPKTSGVRSIMGGHPSKGLTPQRLAAILLGAEGGDPIPYLELAEDMEEKDLHYVSVLGTRKRAVTQLQITVEAADDTPAALEHAELIRTWVKRKQLRRELFDILDAVGKGFSHTEIIWDTSGNQWLPKRLEWRDPRWFRNDLVDGRTPMLVGEAGQLEPLPPYKFITHEHPAKSGLPLRGGIARAAGWAYLFKNYALKDWVAFAEIFGLPLRVGRYDNGETPENISRLMRAVAQIGVDAAAVFPKSMDVQFVDGKGSGGGGKGGGGELFKQLCDYLDQQVSKAVLGQTATTDSVTGGLGSGAEHGDVREDIRDADAELLASTLEEQLVRPIVDLNYGQQDCYPVLSIGAAESIDATVMMGAVDKFVRLGGKISMSEVRDKLPGGFGDPGEDDELLGVPAAAPAAGQDGQTDPANPGEKPSAQDGPPSGQRKPLSAIDGGRSAPTPADRPSKAAAGLLKALTDLSDRVRPPPSATEDAIDRAVAAAGDDWEVMVGPVVEAADELFASCATLEEARDRLAEVMGAADMTALTTLLTRGSLTARMTGLAGEDIHPGADR